MTTKLEEVCDNENNVLILPRTDRNVEVVVRLSQLGSETYFIWVGEKKTETTNFGNLAALMPHAQSPDDTLCTWLRGHDILDAQTLALRLGESIAALYTAFLPLFCAHTPRPHTPRFHFLAGSVLKRPFLFAYSVPEDAHWPDEKIAFFKNTIEFVKSRCR